MSNSSSVSFSQLKESALSYIQEVQDLPIGEEAKVVEKDHRINTIIMSAIAWQLLDISTDPETPQGQIYNTEKLLAKVSQYTHEEFINATTSPESITSISFEQLFESELSSGNKIAHRAYDTLVALKNSDIKGLPRMNDAQDLTKITRNNFYESLGKAGRILRSTDSNYKVFNTIGVSSAKLTEKKLAEHGLSFLKHSYNKNQSSEK